MKKIDAIIQPFKLEEVKQGIEEVGSFGMTVSEEEEYNRMDVCEFGLHPYPEFVERQAVI